MLTKADRSGLNKAAAVFLTFGNFRIVGPFVAICEPNFCGVTTSANPQIYIYIYKFWHNNPRNLRSFDSGISPRICAFVDYRFAEKIIFAFCKVLNVIYEIGINYGASDPFPPCGGISSIMLLWPLL